jgi:hypothetical protein
VQSIISSTIIQGIERFRSGTAFVKNRPQFANKEEIVAKSRNLHARRVANATFYTEGFSSFVASAAASIATGWSEPVPGRV